MSIDRLAWTGNAQGASALHEELQATKRRNSLLQGRAHQLVIQYQMVSLENTHIKVPLYKLSRLYLYI